MADDKRWFWVGSRPDVRGAAAAVFAGEPRSGSLDDAAAGDTIVVDVLAERAELERLPYGHVFSGVRALKQRKGLVVYVVVDAGDDVGVQLSRFALADGVLRWHAAESRLGTDELHATGRPQRRPSVDALLQRLQQDAGASGQENSLQRLMRFEREDTLINRLQDPETGLFDGPYATLKLDEEWKRSHRFHQPLSLLLLDIGLQDSLADADRRAAVAEAAGVFLNECRDIDVLARFSPDVFLLLLPGTGAEGAQDGIWVKMLTGCINASSCIMRTPSKPRTLAISCGSVNIDVVPCGITARANSAGVSMPDSICICPSHRPGSM